MTRAGAALCALAASCATPVREARGLALRCETAGIEDAEVYVDGTLYGTLRDFDGLRGRLRLPPGGHRLEFRKRGYRPFTGWAAPDGAASMTVRLEEEAHANP